MSIVCRPQIVIPMMPGPPAQCRPAAPAGHHFASAQVSSRTRGWEVRVRLETYALAEVGCPAGTTGRHCAGGPGIIGMTICGRHTIDIRPPCN